MTMSSLAWADLGDRLDADRAEPLCARRSDVAQRLEISVALFGHI
jgi:hypothetical protein